MGMVGVDRVDGVAVDACAMACRSLSLREHTDQRGMRRSEMERSHCG
jgi:hypothetical protein